MTAPCEGGTRGGADDMPRSRTSVALRGLRRLPHAACRRPRALSSAAGGGGGGVQPAAFLRGARDMAVMDLAVPELPTQRALQAGAAEPSVLLDIAAVGVCGSDMHYYKDGGIGGAVIDAPFVPGHEFAARVVADDSGELEPGELVAVDPAKPCGRCEWCQRAHPNLCPHVEFTGAPPFHGALTPRIVVAKRQVFRLPAGMSSLEAMMLEPLGVAIHAIDLAKPAMFESVCVVGCGPIGLKVRRAIHACTQHRWRLRLHPAAPHCWLLGVRGES